MTQITAEGESTRSYAAERATLHIHIGVEHGDRHSSIRIATEKHDEIVAVARSLRESGEATWHHADPINTHVRKVPLAEADQHGQETEGNLFITTSRVLVKLSALHRVSEIVTDLLTRGYSVHTSWSLTEERRKEYERYARTRAVQKSRERADEYAEALGEHIVQAVSVTDAIGGFYSGAATRSGAGGGVASPEISIPEIKVSARIIGTFESFRD